MPNVEYKQREEIQRLKNKKFRLPKDLEAIAKKIEDSKYILKLEEGWDEENAKKIEPRIWGTSVNFLSIYANFVYKKFRKIIEIPEINPCRDNSIDLSWETKKVRMLINIRESKDNISAFYYGDFYNNIKPYKGQVPIKPINESLADWMKNLSNE